MQFTDLMHQRLITYLNTHDLGAGLYSLMPGGVPCSIAAINLIISGEVTDDIPDCMSEVVGRFIIRMQDAMPKETRNSQEWKELLPRAAGTGREKEEARQEAIAKWMWGVWGEIGFLLGADATGFGDEWRDMLRERTAAEAEAEAACTSLETITKAGQVDYACGAVIAAAEAYENSIDIDDYEDFWAEYVKPCKMLKELIEI
jgi:hypothetical protein